MTERSRQEQLQRQHYDRLAAQYELHYSDEYSMQYRFRFFYAPMTQSIELKGRRVLDALCGSGQTTHYLLMKGAKVTGLDVSGEVISEFRRRWPEASAVHASILDSKLDDASFDCVMIVGGLHHLHPHVDETIDEVHRILKPGGYFCFMEPHVGSLPDLVRRLWYRIDRKMFEENEGAIDVGALEMRNSRRFEFVITKYCGNVAYLLVLNSLVFRIPIRWKRYYSPLLMKLEGLIGKYQGPALSCFVLGRWRKKDRYERRAHSARAETAQE
jgi:SAM-dependent methyltransferase